MMKRAFSRVSEIANMDLCIISRDTVKPASSSLMHLQPYKLSLFDQLIPTTYVPKLFFYHKPTDHHCNATATPARLKRSFEEALSLYYPFSGRIKNNLCIDDFHTGVPYLEVRVKGSMLEFLMLQEQETELLNCLVPFRPFHNEVDACTDNVRASNLEPVHEGLPMIAVQVNNFSCGGIAIGVSTSHKIFDGQTTNAFLTTWAAICRESHESIVHPNLSELASITFPPRDSLPQSYLQLMERIWFHESNQSFFTRRFMFDAKSIASLQAKAKSELVVKPSRVEALTCFLWKHYEKAMKDSLTKASIVAHAVNMRPRMNPQMPANIIGNLFWWAKAIATTPAGDHELCDLVKMLNTSLRRFNSDYLKTLQGEDGFAVIAESFDQLEAMFSMKSAPKFYAFSSWSGIPKQLDFGWGRPFWIGVSGKTGSPITLLVPRPGGNGIEAWVTLNEKQMDILQKDAEFLEFASPNSCINMKSM